MVNDPLRKTAFTVPGTVPYDIARPSKVHMPDRAIRVVSLAVLCVVVACTPEPPGTRQPPSFSLALDRAAVTAEAGTTAGSIQLSVVPVGGFGDSVSLTIDGLPAGIDPVPGRQFNVQPGGAQSLGFSIAPDVPPGHYLLTIHGSGGGITSVATLAMDVTAHTSAADRYSYLRLSDAASETPAIDGATYDPGTHRAFAIDHLQNSIDVISLENRSLERRIPVPGPLSARMTPDGSRLVVGTRGDEVVIIDPTRLEVIERKVFPPTRLAIGNMARSPRDVAPTANGTWLVGAPGGAAVENQVLQWNPATGAVVDRSSWMFGGVRMLVPNLDGTRVLMAGIASGISIYEATCDCVVASSSHTPSSVAWRPDGQHVVVSEQGAWTVLDTSLQEVARYPTDGFAGPAVYDRSGKHLYLTTPYPSLLMALDATTYAPAGVVPLVLAGQGPPILADESSRVLVSVDRGVVVVDGAHLTVASSPTPSLFLINPSTGDPGGATTVAAVLDGQVPPSSILFGKNAPFGPFTLDPVQLPRACMVQPPPGQPGVVNVSATFPDGWSSLAPDAYSYGPTVLRVDPSGGPMAAGTELTIRGYGFTPEQVLVGAHDTPGLKVQIGGVSAQIDSVGLINSSGLLRMQTIFARVPAAAAAGKAAVTVTTNAGSASVPQAFTYLPNVTHVGLVSSPLDLVYDRWRGVVYASEPDAGAVEIISVAEGRVVGAIRSASSPAGISLAPDGSSLAIADFTSGKVFVVNADDPGGASRSFDVLDPADTEADPRPFSVAFGAGGKVFVGVYRTQAIGCFLHRAVREIDLQSGIITSPTLGGICTSELTSLDASPDGMRVVAVSMRNNSGDVSTWDARSDTFAFRSHGRILARASLSDDAVVLPLEGYAFFVLDRSDVLRTVEAGVQFVDTRIGSSFPNFVLHRSGSVAYVPMGNGGSPSGLGIADAQAGTLRATYSLPDPPLASWGPIAIDEWGAKVFIANAGAVTVVDLGSAPLGIGYVEPSQVPAGGGTAIAIHGSGFSAGAQVKIGGTAATTAYVDANTLSAVAPGGSPGAARVEIVNGNGESYGLDAAISYTQ